MKNQFWADWAAGPVHEKKKFGADYEQLLRGFLCFHWPKKSFENTVASALSLDCILSNFYT
jgi:hypothetical protein